ncbi:glycosyltransferase-like protein [Aureococcus anophagefferens]|nr:glycosyltransferase-like protein [Aureococcus anophagefferens]KAH8071061.1 glycosyltransferase-like protein [Aureococcus anophagefferens]
MVSFDDAGEAALDDEIAAKQREATKLFRACESSLKRVAAHGGDDLSDSERTIRSNIQRSVAMRIQALNTDFRKAQKEYMLAAVVDVENLVDERDGEIKQIAESIQELSTIFKELAVLVIDQGTVLDRIDFNMEQVAEHTRKGVVEIEKAEQYQKAARPRICIALLLFLITIMMIALILKHRDGDKKDDKK